MTNKDKIKLLCVKGLKTKGVYDQEIYKKRLREELVEIDAQNDFDYFAKLNDEQLKYKLNQNNLLVAWLLGIVDDFDINYPPTYVYGDFPDIDIDFLPPVRDYLKQNWAPKEFGTEYVCNIGSYGTFGIKSALQDMARVFSKDRSEIVSLTTKIELKDEDGKPLTWDKALEMYPDLKTYCDNNPEVADATKRLLHRNKSMGKHAGGLIISSKPIDRFVPLVKDKEGNPLSAWVEGLSGQDLGPMGLVKYDYLGITNLMQIAIATDLIKKRYKVSGVCAIPGQDDWTDTSYLNDPLAIEMASNGDLRCIFQFDSDGIRKLVKDGGVDSFDDLVAYSALYRPGPMDMKMHERYVERKRGREEFEIHPLLKPILGKTYGVMAFQEDILKILNLVGNIPLKDCEIVRKAISKKKIEAFLKYKEQFVENGMVNLDWSKEKVEDLWNQIESFAAYGFNASHATAYTYISSRLLWLKAHYPLEFFTAIFSCEGSIEKIKEYMIEANSHGIKVMPPDIDKSGVKFKIVDKDPNCPSKDSPIYFGFSNVKGIGDAAAQRIVDKQPYGTFYKFVEEFGTDQSVIKPLVGLRVFKDGDPLSLYKYYEHYKLASKQRIDRKKRFESACATRVKELRDLFHPDFFLKDIPDEKIDFSDGFIKKLEGLIDTWNMQVESEDMIPFETMEEQVDPLRKKYRRALHSYEKKVEEDQPIRNLYDPTKVEVPEDIVEIYKSLEESERNFYGFLWRHPLEKSPNYKGLTFENLRTEEKQSGFVQVKILSVETKVSKKGNEYRLMKVEDSHSEVQFIQVWSDDWERFGDWLVKNQLVQIKVDVPSGGFNRYTLNGPQKHKRYLLPKDRTQDFRVYVMQVGKEEEETNATD